MSLIVRAKPSSIQIFSGNAIKCIQVSSPVSTSVRRFGPSGWKRLSRYVARSSHHLRTSACLYGIQLTLQRAFSLTLTMEAVTDNSKQEYKLWRYFPHTKNYAHTFSSFEAIFGPPRRVAVFSLLSSEWNKPGHLVMVACKETLVPTSSSNLCEFSVCLSIGDCAKL